MTWLTEQNDWQALPKDEKSFVYEMAVSAIGAVVIVAFLG